MHSFYYFEQNSTQHAYSGLHAYLIFVKIRPCTLIQVNRVLYVALEEIQKMRYSEGKNIRRTFKNAISYVIWSSRLFSEAT